MSEGDDIVKRLMDYDRCHDGDVDEAAKEIESLHARLAAAEAVIEQKDRVIGEYAFSERGLASKLAAAEAELTEANRRLAEIRDELYGNGLEVAGWHQNGELEPLDSWFEHNEWGPVEAAKGGRDE